MLVTKLTHAWNNVKNAVELVEGHLITKIWHLIVMKKNIVVESHGAHTVVIKEGN